LDKFVINGGKLLTGTVTIGGAKNASLALMPATILSSGISHISNTPDLRDILTMSRLLETMGIQVSSVQQTMTLDTSTIKSYEAPYEHVKKMRASIYVLGPLVARFGQAKVSLPGAR
jgi:UDP-N-acetylglucosamine 1-carboxyvinyltransferase